MVPQLNLNSVSRHFGGLKAVSGVSLTTYKGEIFGIVGPNGAGKTTLFNTICGVYRPTSGEIRFEGALISGHPVHEIVRRGLSRSFQIPRLFKKETVLTNLTMAADLAGRPAPWHLGTRSAPDSRKYAAEEIADFIGLSGNLSVKAGELAYGLQKLLGLGVALATKPKILLIDEPAAGLNPSEKVGMADVIIQLRDRFRVDTVIIEHDMRLITRVCDRIAVLDRGEILAIGRPSEVLSNAAVVSAYLGPDHELS